MLFTKFDSIKLDYLIFNPAKKVWINLELHFESYRISDYLIKLVNLVLILTLNSHIHDISFIFPFTLHFTFVTYSFQKPKSAPYPYLKRKKKGKRRRKIKGREKKEVKRMKINIFFHHHLYHLPNPSSSTSFESIIIISGGAFLEIVSFYFLQPPDTLHPKDRNHFELHTSHADFKFSRENLKFFKFLHSFIWYSM